MEAKLSLAEVADELQVSRQAISAWENGTRTIDAFKLADLALRYGVSTDYLMFGTHMVPAELRALFARVGGK